jgi:hypothetical protein
MARTTSSLDHEQLMNSDNVGQAWLHTGRGFRAAFVEREGCYRLSSQLGS